MGKRGPSKNPEVRTQALALRLEGLSFAEIGERVGLSRQRIQQILSPDPAVRSSVVERAEGRCQRCGLHVGTTGHVHHRKSKGATPDDYNDDVNLRLLCPTCHRVEHGYIHYGLPVVKGLPPQRRRAPQEGTS